MINMPLFKCLLAAISVLRCVDAVAPSTNNADVAFEKMISGRALDAPDDIDFGLKDCAAIDDVCTTEDKERVQKKCSGPGGDHKCRKMCRPKYKKLSTGCKTACCPSFTPCQGTLAQFEGGNITTLDINCPLGVAANKAGKAWGSNPYSQDSVFSKAVAHACGSRPITVSIINVGCQQSYEGSTKNGITTNEWGYYCDAYQIICGPLPLTCG